MRNDERREAMLNVVIDGFKTCKTFADLLFAHS
jgi:hypothetical protein